MWHRFRIRRENEAELRLHERRTQGWSRRDRTWRLGGRYRKSLRARLAGEGSSLDAYTSDSRKSLGEPVEMSGLIHFEEKQQINFSVNGCDCKNLKVSCYRISVTKKNCKFWSKKNFFISFTWCISAKLVCVLVSDPKLELGRASFWVVDPESVVVSTTWPASSSCAWPWKIIKNYLFYFFIIEVALNKFFRAKFLIDVLVKSEKQKLHDVIKEISHFLKFLYQKRSGKNVTCRNQDSNLGCFGHNEEY